MEICIYIVIYNPRSDQNHATSRIFFSLSPSHVAIDFIDLVLVAIPSTH